MRPFHRRRHRHRLTLMNPTFPGSRVARIKPRIPATAFGSAAPCGCCAKPLRQWIALLWGGSLPHAIAGEEGEECAAGKGFTGVFALCWTQEMGRIPEDALKRSRYFAHILFPQCAVAIWIRGISRLGPGARAAPGSKK